MPGIAPLTPRQQWREDFIRRQLEGLRDLGLPPQALKREEALLRGFKPPALAGETDAPA
ncbi:MAG TPA: hypothetical protein VG501_04145 [Rhizomicrobium sp.]|nr:hypothetical protein [Rhizomicrobium sp.]